MARLLGIIVLAGVLVGSAQASDELAQATAQDNAASQPQSAPSGQGKQEQGHGPLTLDRRDRIFYPGDTERPKPLLKKLFLNIVFDQQEIFTSPFSRQPEQCSRLAIAGGGNRRADCRRYPYCRCL